MKTAAVWIEGGKLYCFVQRMNPGPSVLVVMNNWNRSNARSGEVTAAGLKERVDDVVRTQQQLAATINIQNGRSRAEALKAYARSDIARARHSFGLLDSKDLRDTLQRFPSFLRDGLARRGCSGLWRAFLFGLGESGF
jgi:hypothetical protein